MNKIEYVWLSNIEISNKEKFSLIKKFENINNLYKSSLDDLVYFGVKDNIIDKILDKNIRNKTLYDLEYMEKNNIKIINFDDIEYPEKFKVIKDRPVSIYVRGNVDILNKKGIAIVGSRMALKESLEISRLTANAFSEKGYNVISGLAKGIDKYSHLGCLDSNGTGKTIGILASRSR